MICPNCKRPAYFLVSAAQKEKSHCHKCGHSAATVWPSYDGYHERLYAKPYRRDLTTDPQMRRLFRLLAIQSNDVVADLGCGVGDYTVEASRLSRNVTGYDQNVEAARKKFPNVNFSQIDFNRALPIADCSVDKLISINTIEHLADEELFLGECRRVLKPGGLIALSTANKSFLLHQVHYDATHLHEWTLEEFRERMRPYFEEIDLRKDSAMFNYYPWNALLTKVFKPDLSFVGRAR